QVPLDDGAQFLPFRGRFRRGGQLVTELHETKRESFRKELIFAIEMPIEAAMGQSQFLHQPSDAVGFGAVLAKGAGRRCKDLLVRLGFLLGWVPHAFKITSIISKMQE